MMMTMIVLNKHLDGADCCLIGIRACLDQRLIAIRSQGVLRDNVRSKI